MNRILALILIATSACAQQEPRSTEQATTQTPAQQTASAEQPPPSETAATHDDAASTAAREQTIQVGAAFTPASVTIPANQPVRLHFRRTDEATCAEEIVLPELNLRKKIAANETVTFDLPAQQARTLTFVCGMQMMKGTVVVQ